MASREELKAEVERVGREHRHTLGPWLDLPHASQVGCLACDRWGFAEVKPPPGKLHLSGLATDCPAPAERRPSRPGAPPR